MEYEGSQEDNPRRRASKAIRIHPGLAGYYGHVGVGAPRRRSMYSKERREHPSFSPRQIRRIVADHKARGNPRLQYQTVKVNTVEGIKKAEALLARGWKIYRSYQFSQVLVLEKRSNPLHFRESHDELAYSRDHLLLGGKFPRRSKERAFHHGVATGIGSVVGRRARTLGHRKTGRRVRDAGLAELAMVQSFPRGNPPEGKLIGRSVLSISTTGGTIKPKGLAPLYGLKDGSVFIRGFFSKVPRGSVTRIEYLDEGKAKREGLKSPSLPWRHDFTRERRPLKKVRGGLLIPRGKRPLWGAR